MAFALSDRVKETTTTTGTGSVTLAGAATGFQTFSSAIGTGNTMYYCIAGQGTSEWEVGMGTLSASTTLARTKIFASSNAGSAVNFSAGTKDVFVTLPASAGYAGASGQVFTASGTFTIPTGITRVKVTVIGGGGGGGGGRSVGCSDYPGNGGGGGGTAIKFLTSLTPGNTLTVTRGAGGSGGAYDSLSGGTSGGTSSVSSGTETITTVSATGGGGGQMFGYPIANGGVGSSADLNINGNAGNAEGGGGTTLGGGGSTTYIGNGTTGGNYGGGGGGSTPMINTGGAGCAGVIIFEW
jgi:hypothetical protein